MLFKISLKNIKKSIKDYSIYFFTLVFAVSMFYIFNSLDAQNSMLQLNSAKSKVAQSLIYILNYVSIFVSIILGFLIIYSNKFLIKRRKKEMGLYLTLGMSKWKVSFILVLETLLIGVFSLFIGLAGGVLLSQLLSILTAKLFEANLSSYHFIFSNTALMKTIMYFSIIFVLVIFFNVFNVSKYKLIDLFNAGKKNEKVKFRNKYLTIISFVLSVSLIGYAYYLLFNNALLLMDIKTVIMLASGALGTFLLFFSLSGFLLKLFQRVKKVYYQNLNMFVLKQVNNKINTTVFSTTIICLMLLLTIGILSGSMSLANAFNQDLKTNNLADFTLLVNPHTYVLDDDGNYVLQESKYDITSLTKEKEFQNMVSSYAVITEYIDKNIITKSLLTKNQEDKLIKEYGSNISFDFNIPIIKESEYITLMKLYQHDYIDIPEDGYLLLANIDFIVENYSPAYQNGQILNINNKKLKPASAKIIEIAVMNANANGNDGIIVVKDNVIDHLEKQHTLIVGNYTAGNKEEIDQKFINYLNGKESIINTRTRIEMEASSIGLKIILTFIGLYLGITFAICSATVLAIGQLSESSDNKERYKVLRSLGADNKIIKKALFTQIGIAFGFPLVIAIIHSIVGLKELNSLIKTLGNIDLTTNIFLTSLFIVVLYGGYFILTYLCSKNIIKD